MRKSLIAVGHLLFRGACVVILFCNLIVLGVYAVIRCSNYSSQFDKAVELILWQKALLVSCIILFFLLGLILYWPKKKRQTATPSKRPFYRKIFTSFSIAFFLYLMIDSPPPKDTFNKQFLAPNDSSLVYPSQELNTLFHSNDKHIPNLRHLNQDRKYEVIETYAAEIETAWQHIAKQRRAVDELVNHTALLHQQGKGHLRTISYSGLKVASIYQSHALLLAHQGHIREAVNSLIKIHDVTCKGLQGSVAVIQKMLWIAIAEHNMRTALQLICEYELDEDLHSKLASTFDPLTDKEVSFFKPWIGEYLSSQDYIKLSLLRNFKLKWYDPEAFPAYRIAKLLPEPFVELLFTLTRQTNRSHQLLYDFWVPVIHTAMTENYGTQILKEKDFYPPVTLRNIGGWYFYQPPQFLAYETRMKILQARSALLYFFLKGNNRAEAEIKLQPASGLRDAGDDSQLGTNDDITLELYYPAKSINSQQ